jgi:hypothetical protein
MAFLGGVDLERDPKVPQEWQSAKNLMAATFQPGERRRLTGAAG